MDKVSNRIWILIVGIAVAIAITISAFAIQKPVPQEAINPGLPKSKVTNIPVILLKKISSRVEQIIK